MRRWLCIPRWITLSLLLLLPCALVLSACPAGRGGDHTDDDDYFDDDDGNDRASRRRKRRRRSRSRSRRRRSSSRKVRVLIDAKRLRDAVIQSTTSGRPREDIARLRRTLCDGRDDAVIFYQLVVSTHWHYYWLCSNRRPQRAATSTGSRRLSTWVRSVERRAAREGAVCTSGSQRVLFRETHESGARAKARCDGRIEIRFPDRFKATRFFTPGGGGSRYASRRAPSNSGSTNNGSVYQRCPPCRCPRSSGGVDCPKPRPCPPPRTCPRCPVPDCRSKEFSAKKTGFWMGVDKACKRICPLIYKECHRIDKKTAMCYTMQTYCEKMCAKRK